MIETKPQQTARGDHRICSEPSLNDPTSHVYPKLHPVKNPPFLYSKKIFKNHVMVKFFK